MREKHWKHVPHHTPLSSDLNNWFDWLFISMLWFQIMLIIFDKEYWSILQDKTKRKHCFLYFKWLNKFSISIDTIFNSIRKKHVSIFYLQHIAQTYLYLSLFTNTSSLQKLCLQNCLQSFMNKSLFFFSKGLQHRFCCHGSGFFYPMKLSI